jgi:hypothetical protein
MSIRELYVDKITCVRPTDQTALNNRDEVYFLVAGASTGGKKVRVSPDSSADYYGLAAGQSAENIRLWRDDLAEGEHLALTVAICEQDNAQLGALVSLVEAIGLTLSALLTEDPDLAGQALEKWVQTGIDLVQSVQKSGDQVIGVFGVKLSVDHGNVKARWLPMKEIAVTSQGDVKAAFHATGSNSVYNLSTSVLDPALVTWGGGVASTAATPSSDVGVAGLVILGDGEVYAGTVVQKDADHLLATVWAPPTSGSLFTEKSHIEGTTISKLAVSAVQLNQGNLAGAFREKDTGNLKVVVWNVDYDGAITRLGDQVAGAAQQVSIGRDAHGKAVTAVVNAAGEVDIAVWDCVLKSGGGFQVQKLGDNSAAPKIKATRVAVAAWGKGVVTAIQDRDNGHLKLIAWEIKGNWQVVKSSEVGTDIQVDRVAVTNTDAPPRNRLATAVRKNDLTLHVHVWDLEADGSAFHLRDSDAPPDPAHIKDVAIASMGALYWTDQKIASGQIATAAIRNTDNKYRLTSWTISGNAKLSRTADITNLEVKQVSLDYLQTVNVPDKMTPMYEMISAVVTADGKLQLLWWRAFIDTVIPV